MKNSRCPLARAALVVAAVLAMAATSSCAGPRSPVAFLVRGHDDEVAAILNAKSGGEADAGYEKLFAHAGRRKIGELKEHPATAIALAAAWQEVRRSVPRRERRTAYEVDRGKLAAFLELAERQTGSPPPAWWARAVTGAHAWHRDNIYFADEGSYTLHDDTKLYLPAGTELRPGAGDVLLTVGGESASLPAGLFADRKWGSPHLSATVAGERVFLASHGDTPEGYDLICLDRSSGLQIWKAKGWAFGPMMIYTGAGYHHTVSIHLHGGRVLVYGAANHAAYIDAFDAADGSALFRFSTECVRQ